MGNYYMEGSLDESTVAAIGLVILAVVFFAIINYILTSLAITRMAENLKIENPWLAWVPVANYYILGEMLSDKVKGNGGVKFLLFYVIGSALSAIPFVNFIVAPVLIVAGILVMYWLFDKYSEKAVMHTVLSLLLAITIIGLLYYPIMIFKLRNKTARY